MKRRLAYFAILLAVLSAMAGCSGRTRIIPRDKLAHVYAEMFVADQWLNDHPSARRIADTSLFYEPIFRKYGYTTEDYLATVDEYISDPEKFSEVLAKSVAILEKQAQEAQDFEDMVNRINAANKSIRGYVARNFDADSVAWADSSILWRRTVADTARIDSLQIDSLARVDSIAKVAADSVIRAEVGIIADSLPGPQSLDVYTKIKKHVERGNGVRAD